MKLQKIKEWKLFNSRPFVLGLVAMIAGVFLAFSFFVSFWFLIGFLVLLACFVGVAIKRDWFSFFKSNLTVSIIILICFFVGLLSMAIREAKFRTDLTTDGFYYVSARVLKVQDDALDKTEWRTFVGEIELYDYENKNNKVLNLDENCYIWLNTKCEIGDKISFIGVYEAVDHNFVKNISPDYECKIIQYSPVEIVGNNKTISEKFKETIWKNISGNMSRDSAGIVFAMLVGDSSKVMSETKDNYHSAGVGHLLAVSGLHVGFMILIISFLFDVFRMNRKVKFFILLIVLSVYCWICGFSYSIVRASIMSIVLLYAGLRGKQYDGFSALAFATILILAFDPYQLFTIGFLLSFFAVLSIVCLFGPLKSYLSVVYPTKLAASLSIGISTAIGILPWQLYYFGYFPLLGVLTNLAVVPLATLAYMISFVCVPLALVWQGFGILLCLPAYLLSGIDWLCLIYNAIPFAQIKSSISGLTIVFWYLALFICSDFLFLGKKCGLWLRLASCLVAIALLTLNVFAVI